MRRILVVDDDPHICLAVRAWLKRYGFKVSIADGGPNGLAALDNSTFDLMIVDIFMPHMRGFRVNQGVSRPCADGAADRDFRIRFCRIGTVRARLCENGCQARRHALPAQAVPADDVA
jgi:DNA-binding NarL/FixJ family response regulator